MVTKLFIRNKKINISTVFITVFISIIHFFIMKIPNKRQLWKIAINHSSDIEYIIKSWRSDLMIRFDDHIKDEKIQFDMNREAEKQPCRQERLINTNILQVKKYCLLIKNK